MAWWLWLVLGLGLTALELLSAGGFYLIFFGLSSFLIGTLLLLGLRSQIWVQWFLFTALSFVLLALFRNPLLKAFHPSGLPVDRLIGEIAIPIDEISTGAVGKAELRGTAWSARNLHHSPLQKGQRCRVQRVDGLMLFLVPE
jgi:membrane protein implicated in regulation of membrane protease activity